MAKTYDRFEAIQASWEEYCAKCEVCIIKDCHSIRGKEPYYIPDMCSALGVLKKLKQGEIAIWEMR